MRLLSGVVLALMLAGCGGGVDRKAASACERYVQERLAERAGAEGADIRVRPGKTTDSPQGAVLAEGRVEIRGAGGEIEGGYACVYDPRRGEATHLEFVD